MTGQSGRRCRVCGRSLRGGGNADGPVCDECLGVPESVDGYLASLAQHVTGPAWHRRRIVAEVREHLADAVRRERETGCDDAEAQSRAVAGLGSPAVMAAEFPRRGVGRRVAVMAVAGVVAVSVTAVAIAPSGPSQARASVVTTRPFPTREWALRCVARWNSPANASLRRLVAAHGPFNVESESTYPRKGPMISLTGVRDVGTPITATFGGCGASAPGEGAVVTFRNANGLSVLALSEDTSGGLTRPVRAFLIVPGRASQLQGALPTTAILPDGSMSTDVQPPPATGSWGGALALSATVLTKRVAITGDRTCVQINLSVTRPSRVTDLDWFPGSKDASPPYDGVPGVSHVERACWEWHGLTQNPLASEPHFAKPWQRQVEIYARDNQVGINSGVGLFFHIVPAKKGQPADARTKHWALVYYAGFSPG
jgi:hypothetical protein